MTESVSFDRAAKFYDATRGFPAGIAERVAAGIAEAAGLTAASRLLEIGVGTGRIALPLSRHAGFYTGVDLSRAMLEVLVEKRRDEPLAVVEGDATRLPFAAASFNLVLGIHVLHLVPEWRAVVAELARVVRPNGAVLLNAPGRASGPDTSVKQYWNQLLADEGWTFEQRTKGERNLDVIAAALGEEGFTERTDGVAAEWPETTSIHEEVEGLAQRVWSSTWEIPEPVFSRAVAGLRAWVAERYSDPHAPLHDVGAFSYALFRRST